MAPRDTGAFVVQTGRLKIMAHSFGQTGLRAAGLLARGAAACAALLALAPWQLQAAVYQVAVNGADNATAQLLLAAGLVDAVVENNLIGPSLGSGVAGDRPVTSDPMFVDAVKSDFRLRPGSPAIDAGMGGPNLGKTDCWGNPRLAGKGVDIGAYEAPADRSRR